MSEKDVFENYGMWYGIRNFILDNWNQSEDTMLQALQTLLQLNPVCIEQLIQYMSPRIQKYFISDHGTITKLRDSGEEMWKGSSSQ